MDTWMRLMGSKNTITPCRVRNFSSPSIPHTLRNISYLLSGILNQYITIQYFSFLEQYWDETEKKRIQLNLSHYHSANDIIRNGPYNINFKLLCFFNQKPRGQRRCIMMLVNLLSNQNVFMISHIMIKW